MLGIKNFKFGALWLARSLGLDKCYADIGVLRQLGHNNCLTSGNYLWVIGLKCRIRDYPFQMKCDMIMIRWEVIMKFSGETKSCFSEKDVITEYPDGFHRVFSGLHSRVDQVWFIKLSGLRKKDSYSAADCAWEPMMMPG